MYVVLLWAYIMEKSSLVRLSLTSKFSRGTFSEQKVALLGRGGMVTFCMLSFRVCGVVGCSLGSAGCVGIVGCVDSSPGEKYKCCAEHCYREGDILHKELFL